ncbi:MAG TPA: chloride channel protein [Myxococcales bacterium]
MNETPQAEGPAGGLAVAPSLSPTLDSARVPTERPPIDQRVVVITALSVALGIASGFVAQILVNLINFVTNLSFFGRASSAPAAPADSHLGLWLIAIPVIGGIIVGLMARYGSEGIRGHGIPEAMEKVLTSESRVPMRLTFLKPLSAAVAIGTGGPFGAEGPIIATGGALGSLIGQVLRTSSTERKTLLSAGAAAGMAATFGAPVSAVLLAVELLLFELRARSLIPVALAAAAAASVRFAFVGSKPFFALELAGTPTGEALAVYCAMGILLGFAAIVATRFVFAVENAFEKLPIHWMWWPALGGIAVGVIGIFAPLTLGVGYSNIDGMLSGTFTVKALAVLTLFKLVSWAIALGSGTSGGTLAPLFTVGGGLGGLAGYACAAAFPSLHVDPRIAALVGMAAIFAGASHAFLASVVFAFEATRQPVGLLPLLLGCASAYLVSLLFMRTSIMTEKIERRGIRVVQEYVADFLDRVLVKDQMRREVISLRASEPLADARARLAADPRHQGFPVVDDAGRLRGVVMRREIMDDKSGALRVGDLVRRPAAVVFEDNSLRAAADHMLHENVGRMPVVRRDAPQHMVGFLTRSDILAAHHRRLGEVHPKAGIGFAGPRFLRRKGA